MSSENGVELNWSRRRRLTVKLFVVLLGILFGLLVVEVALRIVGYTYPIFYTTDPYRGYALQPGVEGWYKKEGVAFVRVNSDGLRDREHAKTKPPNTYRIAVLGDSYAEALQVPVERAFWWVMQEQLRGCAEFTGRDVEVINFGVSGYGTAQELITLRQKVWDYSPDLVLLAVTTNNDVTDNSRALKKTDEVPYFVHRDGRLVLDDSFKDARAFRLRRSALNRFGRWIRDHSRVIQAAHQGHGALKSYIASWKSRRAEPTRDQAPSRDAAVARFNSEAAAAPEANFNPEELGTDNLVYAEPRDAVWADAWRITEELLAVMHKEVAAHGTNFLVVTLSNGIQVHPDPTVRAAFVRRVRATDIFYPDRRIKAAGEREGFAVLNLAPALQEYAERHKVFLHGFGNNVGNGHWNEEGHRLAGEMLAREFCGRFAKR